MQIVQLKGLRTYTLTVLKLNGCCSQMAAQNQFLANGRQHLEGKILDPLSPPAYPRTAQKYYPT